MCEDADPPPLLPQGFGSAFPGRAFGGRGNALPYLTIVPVPLPSSVPRTTSSSSREFPLQNHQAVVFGKQHGAEQQLWAGFRASDLPICAPPGLCSFGIHGCVCRSTEPPGASRTAAPIAMPGISFTSSREGGRREADGFLEARCDPHPVTAPYADRCIQSLAAFFIPCCKTVSCVA